MQDSISLCGLFSGKDGIISWLGAGTSVPFAGEGQSIRTPPSNLARMLPSRWPSDAGLRSPGSIRRPPCAGLRSLGSSREMWLLTFRALFSWILRISSTFMTCLFVNFGIMSWTKSVLKWLSMRCGLRLRTFVLTKFENSKLKYSSR